MVRSPNSFANGKKSKFLFQQCTYIVAASAGIEYPHSELVRPILVHNAFDLVELPLCIALAIYHPDASSEYGLASESI